MSVRHLADLDACPGARRHLLRDGNRLVEACCGDDHEAADDLFRFAAVQVVLNLAEEMLFIQIEQLPATKKQ